MLIRTHTVSLYHEHLWPPGSTYIPWGSKYHSKYSSRDITIFPYFGPPTSTAIFLIFSTKTLCPYFLIQTCFQGEIRQTFKWVHRSMSCQDLPNNSCLPSLDVSSACLFLNSLMACSQPAFSVSAIFLISLSDFSCSSASQAISSNLERLKKCYQIHSSIMQVFMEKQEYYFLAYRINISANYTGASKSYLSHPYPSR